jgi:pyridoxine 5-phosphate synthase
MIAEDRSEPDNSGRQPRAHIPALGVNIDHVATVRQARQTFEPDPAWAAMEAQLAGADAITFHLREDRRHINDRDAKVLKQVVAIKLNMEMSVEPAIVKIAVGLKPDQCTLVPEKRQEVTTEGGLDVAGQRQRVAKAVRQLKKAGCLCSAFIEPIPEQIRASAAVGFDTVELWSGGYANAKGEIEKQERLQALREGVIVAQDAGLNVNVGHGLTYYNIAPVAAMAGLREFHIGHSIIARAMFVGVREAVRQMKDLLIQYAPKGV